MSKLVCPKRNRSFDFPMANSKAQISDMTFNCPMCGRDHVFDNTGKYPTLDGKYAYKRKKLIKGL